MRSGTTLMPPVRRGRVASHQRRHARGAQHERLEQIAARRVGIRRAGQHHQRARVERHGGVGARRTGRDAVGQHGRSLAAEQRRPRTARVDQSHARCRRRAGDERVGERHAARPALRRGGLAVRVAAAVRLTARVAARAAARVAARVFGPGTHRGAGIAAATVRRHVRGAGLARIDRQPVRAVARPEDAAVAGAEEQREQGDAPRRSRREARAGEPRSRPSLNPHRHRPPPPRPRSGRDPVPSGGAGAARRSRPGGRRPSG